jgi:AcrR family transcriptional regulator
MAGHDPIARHPAPRRDQLRNRRALVQAAQALFAELGLDVPLDAIAKRAGLGNATLYRHFPDRRALIVLALLVNLARHQEAITDSRSPTAEPSSNWSDRRDWRISSARSAPAQCSLDAPYQRRKAKIPESAPAHDHPDRQPPGVAGYAPCREGTLGTQACTLQIASQIRVRDLGGLISRTEQGLSAPTHQRHAAADARRR